MRTYVAMIGVLLALVVAPASARTITFEQIELQTIPISAGLTGEILSYDPFDPDKGTLKRVDVQFNYALTVNLVLQQNFVPIGFGVAPAPYSGLLSIETSFDSVLGGLSGKTLAPQLVPFFADGLQTTSVIFQPYFYSFSVEPPDPINTVVGPLVSLFGTTLQFDPLTTDDFLPIVAGVTGLQRSTLFNVSVSSLDPRALPVATLTTGAMTLTYVYDRTIVLQDPDDPDDPGGPTTPPVDPPAVVPLPAGAPLLLAGLGMLGWLRRRRAAR